MNYYSFRIQYVQGRIRFYLASYIYVYEKEPRIAHVAPFNKKMNC